MGGQVYFIGTLNNSNTISPTFIAPQILGTRTQLFRLTVKDDDGEIGSANVTITTTYTAPDTDGDGIHDAYETANGLNPNNAADANQDYDGDGISNKNEYLGGTNPRSDDIHDRNTPFLPPWALMLLGSGLAGAVLKQQKKQKELRA